MAPRVLIKRRPGASRTLGSEPQGDRPAKDGGGIHIPFPDDVSVVVEDGEAPLHGDSTPEGNVQQSRGLPVDPGEQRERGQREADEPEDRPADTEQLTVGAAHAMHREEPAAFNAAVIGFITAHR